ncbi:MAG: imidazole glycerol phosphate synthase subunit HisH [Thermanaerothrix sp.]|uniref:imidazole glycerol phosphate synthase subunit HisH n=1 Tax=Thermanaerothrix sp. TaxID=2972675 RepID=UPI003C7A7B33
MSEAVAVTVVDAGTGNLRSVVAALRKIGADVTLTPDPEVVRRASRVILPGVGAFGEFMRGLRERNLVEALHEVIAAGRPLLGICVGMQALLEVSEEMGVHAGLGILPGRVVRFDLPPAYKVPHTGWNQLWPQRDSPLFAGLRPGDYVYFNHGYYCQVDDPRAVLALTDYGVDFASAVAWENVCGVQFHPEKSQAVGERLLRNFLTL